MSKGLLFSDLFPKVFEVIDKKTGKEADIQQIAKEIVKEDRVRLVPTEVLGFFISEDGTLYLADRYGNFVACSYDRFKVVLVGEWRVLGDY